MTMRETRPSAWRHVAGRLGVELTIAIILFATLRLLLSTFAALVAMYVDPPGPCHQELAFADWDAFPRMESGAVSFPLFGVWQRWDACWYIKIASFGYVPGENATAFFPLYPAITRILGLGLGGSFTVAGLIASAIAYVVAMVGLLRLGAAETGRPTAVRAALYLSIFPSAFFLFAPFTEALFLASVVWALWGARQGRWGVSALAGLAAALTRTHGVLLVLPVAWEAARWARSRWRPAQGAAPRPMMDLAPPALAVLAPLAGFGAFSVYAAAVMGQSPADAQGYWGGANFHPPWEVLAAAITWSLERGDAMELINVGMLLFAGVMLVPIFRRLPLAYGLYALPHVAVMATRILPTPLTSTSRFVLVIFPIFMVLAIWGRHPWVHHAWIVGSALLLGFLTYLFVIGDFVA